MVEQKDLFKQESVSEDYKQGRLRRLSKILDRYLQIRMDRLIMISLGFFLLLILSYSLGFERGVKVSMEKGTNLLIKEWFKPSAASSSPKTVLVSDAARIKTKDTGDAQKRDKSSTIASSGAAEDVLRDSYTIQLITYVSDDRAQREVEFLASKGWESFVIPSGRYYIVCVNYYESKQNAVEALKEIKKESRYSDAFIRRVNR